MRNRIFHRLWRDRAAWLVPLGWACTLCAQVAQASGPALETTFGPPPMPSHWGQRVQPLVVGQPMAAGDYRIRAEVVPRFAGDAAPASGTRLSPGAVLRHADGTTTAVWNAPAHTRLSDFDTLVVEHGNDPSCALGLSLALHGGNGSGNDIGAAAGARLALQDRVQGSDEVVMSEQPPQMEWARKDFSYLLRRQLGLSGDSRWRYAQDGDFTVIQRRLDVALARVHTIELTFPSKTVLSGVNLSVGSGPAGRADRLLSGGDFTSRTEDDGEHTRVFLYLGSALSTHPSEEGPYLKEILIAYQGTETEVAQHKPLRAMRMMATASPPASGDSPAHAIESMPPDSAGKTRWQSRFDLQRWHTLATHTIAALEATAPEGCDTGSLQARLLSSRQAHLPLFRTETEQQLKALGGPFLPPDDGSTEWFQWVAQLPLAQARPVPQRLDTPGFQAELPGWQARWTLEGEAAGIAISDTGLLISAARTAQLEWTADVAVQPALRLYVGIPSGARQFDTLDIELQLDSGAVWPLQAAPNQAVPLPDGLPPHSRVRSVRVRFTPRHAPEDWALASLGIFRPYAVPLAQIADQPRPGWRRAAQALTLRGTAAADAADAGYQWDMPVGLRSGDLLQASITHGFNATRAGACWLTVEATGDKGAHVRQRLCPSGPNWQVGLAALWRQGRFAADETVVSMRWTAQLSAPPGRPDDFSVALGVGASPSARQVLSSHTGLRLGTAAILSPQGEPAALPALSLPIWLDYGPWTAAEGQAVPAVHWDGAEIFELRRLTWVAAPALWPALLEQQHQQQKRSVAAAPSTETGLRYQSAWLLLFAALVAGFAGRAPAFGLTLRHRASALAHRLNHTVRPAWTRLHGMLPARSPSLPIFAGTAFAALLAWLGGRGGVDAPWLALTATFVAVLTCIRLWAGGIAPPPSPSRQRSLHAAAVLAIVAMAWLLGRTGLPRGPLTYAGLAFAVFLFDRGLPLRLLRYLAAALGNIAGALAAVSAAFYALGSAAWDARPGESVWLTMGAIAATAAWWHLLQGLRPALAARQPQWADRLFTPVGAPLFAGALVALALSTVSLYFGGHRLAAHLTTLFFYQWCAGAVLTAFSPWARSDRPA